MGKPVRSVYLVCVVMVFSLAVRGAGSCSPLDDLNPATQTKKAIDNVKNGNVPLPSGPLPHPIVVVHPKDVVTPVQSSISGVSLDPGSLANKLAPGVVQKINKKAFDLSVKAATWPIDLAKSGFQKIANTAKQEAESLWKRLLDLIRNNLPLAVAYVAGGLVLLMAVGTFLGMALFKLVASLFMLFVFISRKMLRIGSS
ncbi:hypothetical protein ACXHMN_03310 [Rhizobium sp. LEGMi12c]